MTAETHVESGTSPPRKRPDFRLYFKTAPKSRNKPVGTKFKRHLPPKTRDDLRRLRAELCASQSTPKRRRSAPTERRAR